MICSASSLKFLFIGRPTWTKGLPDLLQALEELQDLAWTLTIVGHWAPPLPQEIERLRSRCRLIGAVENAEIPAYMQAADAVVVPSRYDNFCNVALESMAAGRAVLGSRCGGIPDLVEDGVTGLLFDPGSVEQLIDTLRRVLHAPAELARMGRNGWSKARRYSWQRVGHDTDLLLRQALEDKIC